MDVVSALKLSQNTIAHLNKMKENDFDAIYKICEKNDFNIQNTKSRRLDISNDLYEEYKQKYNKIIEVFINELSERFNFKNYEKLVQFYEWFTTCDYNKEINIEKLQSYNSMIDLNRFEHESKAFVCYKQQQTNLNWNNIDELCRHFQRNKLKQLFPEENKCLYLYLSIPATTATAERSFLKLLKT
jgi:hypothetical protein